MTSRDVLAATAEQSKALFGRYLKGFDDASGVAQPPALPNHVIWALGHCAATMHRVAGEIDGRPIPDGDFIVSPTAVPGKPDLAARGDARRFHFESVAFGSAPSADPSRYPPLARAKEIYDAACDRIAAAVRGAPDEALGRKIPWGGGQQSLWELVLRMLFHNGMHTGQTADTRRALGMGSIM